MATVPVAAPALAKEMVAPRVERTFRFVPGETFWTGGGSGFTLYSQPIPFHGPYRDWSLVEIDPAADFVIDVTPNRLYGTTINQRGEAV